MRTEVGVQSLRLIADGVTHTTVPIDITLSEKENKVVTLTIEPNEPGELKITQIVWNIFYNFSCVYNLMYEPQLRPLEKIFCYKVYEQSSDLGVELVLNRRLEASLIYNESVPGILRITPSRPIKNCYIVTSFSKLFGFSCSKIADNNSFELQLRAQKKGDLNVKFLLRYEVDDTTEKISRFRFKRIELNLRVKELFTFKPYFHVSKKVCDMYNTQLVTQMWNCGDSRQLNKLGSPEITQIRLIMPDEEQQQWSLEKKGASTHFFIMQRGGAHNTILNFLTENIRPLPSQTSTVLNNQIQREVEKLKTPLSLIILWQLDEITGFTVLKDLKPQNENQVNKRSIRQPIVTFSFPDSACLGENINFDLTIKNPNDQPITQTIRL